MIYGYGYVVYLRVGYGWLTLYVVVDCLLFVARRYVARLHGYAFPDLWLRYV